MPSTQQYLSQDSHCSSAVSPDPSVPYDDDDVIVSTEDLHNEATISTIDDEVPTLNFAVEIILTKPTLPPLPPKTGPIVRGNGLIKIPATKSKSKTKNPEVQK